MHCPENAEGLTREIERLRFDGTLNLKFQKASLL